jgi:hypothetical protein
MSGAYLARLVLLIGLVLAIAPTVFAEIRNQEFVIISESRGNVTGLASYETANAYVGNTYLQMTVSLKSLKDVGLEVRKCESRDEPRIQCTQEGSPKPGTELNEMMWQYRISINPGVEPRPFPLTLTFGYHDGTSVPEAQEVQLLVGVTSKGKVRRGDELSQPPEVFTGVNNQLRVKLVNDFSNYPVKIQSITVRSDPDWIIDKSSSQANTTPNVTISPGGGAENIDVHFKVAPVGFSTLLTGFGATPKINLDIVYDDGYGRKVTDFTLPVTVKVRPRDRILVLAMFVGVLAGTFIKFYLQRLQETGQITRRQALKFAGTTIIIGLIVAVIAMVAKIQIVAFTASGSYDQPLVIFIIAMAGALGGAQILSSWFKTKGADAK